MGAWKSSDGGSVQIVGQSAADTTPGVGTADIVSAVTNTKGVTISFAMMKATNSGDNGLLLIGSIPLMGVHFNGAGSPIHAHLHAEYFVPAGLSIQLQTVAGSVRLAARYKIH